MLPTEIERLAFAGKLKRGMVILNKCDMKRCERINPHSHPLVIIDTMVCDGTFTAIVVTENGNQISWERKVNTAVMIREQIG